MSFREMMVKAHQKGITSWICPIFGCLITNNRSTKKYPDGAMWKDNCWSCFWACGHCGVSADFYPPIGATNLSGTVKVDISEAL